MTEFSKEQDDCLSHHQTIKTIVVLLLITELLNNALPSSVNGRLVPKVQIVIIFSTRYGRLGYPSKLHGFQWVRALDRRNLK